MAEVILPALGESITEGTIAQWLKSVGDTVEIGEPLFEISTDKVDSEIESPAAGVLTQILAAAGESVDVGAVVAMIGVADYLAEPLPSPEPPAPDAEAEASPAGAPAPTKAPAPIPPPSPYHAAPSAQPASGQPLLSPHVRRKLVGHAISPATIRPSGRRGRITATDVAHLEEPAAAVVPVAVPAPVGLTTSTPPVAVATVPTALLPGSTATPMTPIRRRIAEHMVRSKGTSPHAWVTVDVDYWNVDLTRRAAKDQFREREGVSLTYLPFIARATIDALREYPLLNASINETEIVLHRAINLGVAVDLDFEGLVVVVARDADSKRLGALASETATLARAARTRAVTADQISGSTFTITNVGSHGAANAVPIINQPEVGILATGTINQEPSVINLPDGSPSIGIRPRGALSLAWDHRAVDGAYASSFLSRTKQILETRDWTQEI